MSRDPIGEPGFDQLIDERVRSLTEASLLMRREEPELAYLFVANHATGRYDPFGLKELNPATGMVLLPYAPKKKTCNWCGKIADGALMGTQADVTKRFNALSRWQQFVNCRPWKFPGLGPPWDLGRALYGWDIADMVSPAVWPVTCGPGIGGKGPCGKPKVCESTVWLSSPGGCYFNWDVNYVLWGWLANLCDMPREQMLLAVTSYKPLKEAFSDVGWEQAVGFADSGYHSYPTISHLAMLAPPTRYKSCQDCGVMAWSGTFRFNSTWPHASWRW